MEYSEVIEKRYSVRKYSEKPVEKEKLDKVLNAGRIAPTAGNSQRQRILVVQSKDALERMHTCTPCHFDAPVVLLVCYTRNENPRKGEWSNGDFGRVDASIVLTHMMLQAADLGLGSCWVGMYKQELLRECFNIPDRYEILSIMPIGYPAEDAEPRDKHYERLPIEDTVFYDTF